MLSSIIVTSIVIGALGYALRSDSDGKQILHRPYNNRYNDASGSRDFTLWKQ